ncbi:hypothetical protein AXG93_903s1150 [Marchantia polymorpha subsp. ruderalis]|uniref:Uncharacterized protein n=1 Tax=Marchantia polymorpha subsp. ruderalis TaxID=1480154 RepID=A0A176VZC3_MARPO|nr:hypothetical protein AXG93_903s1150 [Marchantia polymorpha subsp. ruderalis]
MGAEYTPRQWRQVAEEEPRNVQTAACHPPGGLTLPHVYPAARRHGSEPSTSLVENRWALCTGNIGSDTLAVEDPTPPAAHAQRLVSVRMSITSGAQLPCYGTRRTRLDIHGERPGGMYAPVSKEPTQQIGRADRGVVWKLRTEKDEFGGGLVIVFGRKGAALGAAVGGRSYVSILAVRCSFDSCHGRVRASGVPLRERVREVGGREAEAGRHCVFTPFPPFLTSSHSDLEWLPLPSRPALLLGLARYMKHKHEAGTRQADRLCAPCSDGPPSALLTPTPTVILTISESSPKYSYLQILPAGRAQLQLGIGTETGWL